MPYRTLAPVEKEDNKLYSGSLDMGVFKVPLRKIVPSSDRGRANWWSEADRRSDWSEIQWESGMSPYIRVCVHMTLRMWVELGASLGETGQLDKVPPEVRYDIIHLLAERMKDTKKPITSIGEEEMVLFFKSLLLLKKRRESLEKRERETVEEDHLRGIYSSSKAARTLFELLGILTIPAAIGASLYQILWLVLSLGLFSAVCLIAREACDNKYYAALREAEEKNLLLAERAESLTE